MLTATYDGETLHIYKNVKLIGEHAIHLSDDESIVRVAPLDPWDHQRRFNGEIRNFTIWKSALSVDALRALNEAAPPLP